MMSGESHFGFVKNNLDSLHNEMSLSDFYFTSSTEM